MKMLETFSAGEFVPEWLIYIEPKRGRKYPDGAKEPPRASAFFNFPVDVFEHEDAYWIIPKLSVADLPNSGALIEVTGDNYKAGAASKRIILPFKFQMFELSGEEA